jgi:hypothetical protein
MSGSLAEAPAGRHSARATRIVKRLAYCPTLAHISEPSKARCIARWHGSRNLKLIGQLCSDRAAAARRAQLPPLSPRGHRATGRHGAPLIGHCSRLAGRMRRGGPGDLGALRHDADAGDRDSPQPRRARAAWAPLDSGDVSAGAGEAPERELAVLQIEKRPGRTIRQGRSPSIWGVSLWCAEHHAQPDERRDQDQQELAR